MAGLSPMMQQYMQIKEQYKEEVLFFRLGDFYEMFFDDAIRVSKELELTLTGRDCGLPERAPMCGIPYHSFEGYVQKLLAKGYHVAICEQLTDPSASKGIVERGIVRVYTPGTVLESGMLEEGKNNFLCSVATGPKHYSLCFADVSTGQLYLCSVSGSDRHSKVLDQISKFEPSEVLLCENSQNVYAQLAENKDKFGIQTLKMVPNIHSIDENAARIAAQFGAVKVDDSLQVLALSTILFYIDSTQQKGTGRIRDIIFFDTDQYMGLDITAKRNLELTQNMTRGEKKGSLLWVVDKTRTAMGKRLMRSFVERPLTDRLAVENRLDAVEELVNNVFVREEIREALNSVSDLERLMSRILYGSASPKELVALSYTIGALPGIKELLSQCNANLLKTANADMSYLQGIKVLIDNAITDDPPATLKDGRVIRYGYHPEVDELRDLIDNSKDVLLKMESQLKETTGIKTLKVGYNRVFGYYIEVSKLYKDQVPEHFIRKQTLVNGERFITQELKDLEAKILGASDRIIALERSLFENVCNQIVAHIEEIETTSHQIALIDALCSFAHVSSKRGYCRPNITENGVIDIKDGRHPVVEALQKDYPFVPNDVYLDGRQNQIALITGPNMAGKSTYMRQTALICIMAQMGCFVPASFASLCLVDAVFTRVGASDDLSTGKSTFMVEMSEVSHILKYATKKSLLILDEIGRGTSTFDGMSIARAVVEYIGKKIGAKTMFATHYHELTVLESEFDNIKNYNIAVKKRGDDITFLRRIVRGGADRSYGIEVAKLAGVNDSVVSRAKEILQNLESGQTAPAVQTVSVQTEAEPNLFDTVSHNILKEKLLSVDVNTLTPIEAMNTLYELCKIAREE